MGGVRVVVGSNDAVTEVGVVGDLDLDLGKLSGRIKVVGLETVSELVGDVVVGRR